MNEKFSVSYAHCPRRWECKSILEKGEASRPPVPLLNILVVYLLKVLELSVQDAPKAVF